MAPRRQLQLTSWDAFLREQYPNPPTPAELDALCTRALLVLNGRPVGMIVNLASAKRAR